MEQDPPAIPEHILVRHGKLCLQVPRSLFKGPEADLDPRSLPSFQSRLRSRYPWLTENALEVIMLNARREMRRVLWEEKRGATAGRELMSRGQVQSSIHHLKEHLQDYPGDSDAWYALGEALCKAGRTEEGYQAFRRGRDLF
ncbi:MAG: tetratricopeptide repeat protein [Candidatus Methanomethylophilaceae archaeon]